MAVVARSLDTHRMTVLILDVGPLFLADALAIPSQKRNAYIVV